MKSFPNLQALADYVPNCVICNKHMPITIDGHLSALPSDPLKNQWGKSARLLMERQYTLLHAKHKSLKLVINPVTNEIEEGHDVLMRMSRDTIYARKSCPTCHFKIITTCDVVDKTKKLKSFPALTLDSEELHFTMKGGKDVRIQKHYFDHIPDSERTATIYFAHRALPPMPVDFDKFNSFEHLVKRINTIVVFH